MTIPALILLAAAVAAPDKPQILVTGHQWAPFISPMGEPFRAHSATDDTLADWFYRADTNRDGVLTAAEMVADAERFFARLDTNHDGQIDPDELSTYEYEIAPDIQVMSRTKRVPGQPAPIVKAETPGDLPADPREHRGRHRGDQMDAGLGIGSDLQGAARYGLLNMPEPVAAADTDFDRAITLQEFEAAALERFQLLDKAKAGKLTLAQLEAMPHAPSTDKHHRRQNEDAPDERLGNTLPTGP
jgi:Ca2+-binding EF-hand superfamily protein